MKQRIEKNKYGYACIERKGRITKKSMDREKPWQKGYMTERRGNKNKKRKRKDVERINNNKNESQKIWVKK